MNKPFITLVDHDNDLPRVVNPRIPVDNNTLMFNGISCPTCGNELVDINPLTIQRNGKIKVKCNNCNYNGYKKP